MLSTVLKAFGPAHEGGTKKQEKKIKNPKRVALLQQFVLSSNSKSWVDVRARVGDGSYL